MNKLPSDCIRLLSSSQVITSPSTVVKELFENAFDAGATTLDVKLEKFGLEKIEVRDNGCGIKQSDTEFMAQQYYTSKISKHEDLQMLQTYGFRGEALGSLCQVADVCIITRTAEDTVAVSYHLDHNGKVCSTKPTHDGVGTTVIATNLFKNFPVRKQRFQSTKKGKEELKKIEDLLMAYGLINPEVRITLRNNKNAVWQKNKSSDLRTALTDVFAVQIVSQFEYFDYYGNDLCLTLRCFVPKCDSDPQLMWKSSDDRSFIFINKRFVIWKELSQLLKKLCVSQNNETTGKYPLCLVSVCLSSQDVDANLEPNKTKVIINHKEEVLEIITKELHKIYNASDLQQPEKIHGVQKSSNVQSSISLFSADERTDLDQTSETNIQKVSEIVQTTSDENKRLNNVGRTEKGCSVDQTSMNDDASVSRKETLNEENDSDDLSIVPPILDLNISSKITNNSSSYEEMNVANTDNRALQNDYLVAEDSSSMRNNTKDDLISVEEKNGDNVNITAPTIENKEGDKRNNVDKLLENFINDSDIIDDSLLDVSLETIIAPNQEQWSKGRALIDNCGKTIEPVNVLRPSVFDKENTNTSKTTPSGKRKQDNSVSKSDRPSKKNKKHSMISGQSSLMSVLQSPKTSLKTHTRGKTKEIPFSLQQLKTLASRDRVCATTVAKTEVLQLIKRLDPWGVWLVHKNRKLFILNPYRIQELLLYKKLLSTHEVPTEKLVKSIILDERILGGTLRYSFLKELVVKSAQDVNIRTCCDDKRLVSNGFEISGKLDNESGEIILSLLKMNSTIPYFGVSELVEILDLIKANECNPEKKNQDLANYRTSKVCSFLKDEVARISRSLPSRMTETDIMELLKNMNDNLTENQKTCVHNRPLLYSLVSF